MSTKSTEETEKKQTPPTAPGEPGLGLSARYQLPCDERVVAQQVRITWPGCLMFPTCTLLGVRLESLPGREEATCFLMIQKPAAKNAWLTHRAGRVGQLHQTAAPVCTGLPLMLPQTNIQELFQWL